MKSDFGTNQRGSRAIAILLAAFSLVAAAPDWAAAQVRADFNGDGVGDLAIGTPDESVVARRVVNGTLQPVTIAGAGTVTIVYGTVASGAQITSASPSPQLIHQDVASVEDVVEANDRFGAALATGNFNGDDFGDLIVVVPGDNLIQLFHGTATGLDLAGDRIISGEGNFFDNAGAPMTVNFKAGLARGNFNGDDFDDIAVEATRFFSIGEQASLVVMGGGSGGIRPTSARIFSFSNSDIAAEAPGIVREMTLAAGDFTGDGADDLAVGLPDADVFDEAGELIFDAGGVFVMRGALGSDQFNGPGGIRTTGATALTELDANAIPRFNEGFGSALAAGDFDGDGTDDLAVGAPLEDVPNNAGNFVADGGFLAVFSQAETLHGIYTQLPLGLTPQAGDRFAAALASADFDNDGAEDLAIGSPGDAVGGVTGAGSVIVLFGIRNVGLPRPATFGLPQINGRGQTLTQATTDVSDTPERDDHFGQTLSASDAGRTPNADLIIGVPDEDLLVVTGGDLNGIETENRANVGAVHVLYGAAAGLTGAGSHFISQTSAPDFPETGDRFASALP